MNCDDAFDILTRGPFPSGNARTDELVEGHLAACHECRQLAEALRPAVGLFHETLTATETLCLPGYRGELRPAGAATLPRPEALALPTSGASAFSSSPATLRRPARGRWMLLAACLLGMGFGALASAYTDSDRTASQEAHGAASVATSPATRTEHDRELLLTLMNLPRSCRSDARPSGLELRNTHQCCTLCHNATESATAPEVKLSMMIGSCLVCHPDNQRARFEAAPAARTSTAQI